MATKRKAPDAAGDHHHTSKRPKYTNPNKPANLSGKKSFKKAHPVNELKSQIRSLKRLLERQDSSLPANIRVEKERALKTATKDLEDAIKAKKKSDVIGKWHKIRFFDRQKAERRLKRARKENREEEVVRDMEVDVNYAIYFPLERDYVPLFPRKDKKEESEGEVVVEREGDKEMWELVRKCMREGTLKDLREGRLLVDKEEEQEETVRDTGAKSKAKMKRKDEDEAGESEDSDDEAGGAFFGDD